MKQKQIRIILFAEGAVCALLALALRLIEGDAFSVAGFPGDAIGRGLSALASSGRVGFAMAFTLYAFCVLLPLYVLARVRARRDWRAEDALLAGWVVLRLLRRFSDGGTQELLKLFRVMLALAAACFVFAVCFAGFAGLLSAADTLRAGNTAFGGDAVLPSAVDITGTKSLAFSYVILALRFAAESLPSLLAAATAYFAVGLLDTMENGAFTQESAVYAPKLAAWCVKTLRISVLFTLAVDLLQAVCAPMILSASISIQLPLFELCFVLAALLGARLIASNVALAADNDLFI